MTTWTRSHLIDSRFTAMRQNLAINPSFEVATSATYTNLLTNPSWETAAATYLTIRTNQLTNPNLSTGIGSWTTTSASHAATTGGRLFTATAAGSPAVRTPAIAITPGTPVTVQMTVGVPLGQPARTFNLVLRDGPATTGPAAQVINPGETVTLTYSGNGPAFAPPGTTIQVELILSSAAIGDQWVIYDNVTVEAIALVRPMFSGSSTLADPDLSTAWTGTANASTSIVRGVEPAAQFAGIRSTQWSRHGTASLRKLGGNTSSDSYAVIASTPAGGNFGAQLQAGKTYTVVGWLRQDQALTGGFNANGARQIVYIGTGGNAGTGVKSTQAANAAGVYEHRLTFTVVSSDYAQIRLYNGTSANNGDVWWDDLVLVEGTYSGGYFDGTYHDDPDLVVGWNGAANASTSTALDTAVDTPLWTNAATNPSYETASGTTTTRTNLFTNPSFEVNANGLTIASATITRVASTTTFGGYHARATYTSTPSTVVDTVGTYANAVAGPFAISMYVRPSVDRSMSISAIHAASAGATGISNPTVFCPANVWTRLTWTGTLVASGQIGARVSSTAQFAIGDTVDFDALLFERASTVRPYFDGTVRPAVWTNYARDPRARTSTVWGSSRWFGSGGSGTYSLVSDAAAPLGTGSYRRKTWSVAPAGGNGDTGFAVDVTGMPVDGGLPISAWMRSSASTPKTGVLRMQYPGGSTVELGPRVSLLQGVWTQVTGALPLTPPSGWTGRLTTLLVDVLFEAGQGIWQPGDTLDATALMIGPGGYFDGASTATTDLSYAFRGAPDASVSDAYDTDLVVAWSGTADGSTSVQRGAAVADGNAGSHSAAVQSSQWDLTGTKSLRIIPTSPDNNDSRSAPGGDTGGMRLGMQAGKTYTAMATARLTAPLAGGLQSNSRRITAWFNTGGYVTVASTAAANAAGVYPLRLTFTVPANATEAFIRLYNGASSGNGDVWWDDFLLVEGEYPGPYFDGSNNSDPDLTVAWNGPVDASTSTAYGEIVRGTASPAQLVRFRTNLARDPAGTALSADNGPRFQNDRYGSASYSLLTGLSGHPAGLSTAVRFTASAAGTGRGFNLAHNPDATPNTARMLPVTAGDTLSVSCWINSTRTMNFAIYWRPTDGTSWIGGSASAGPSVSCPSGVWTRVSHTFTVPAGATYVALLVRATSVSSEIGDTIDGTGLLVEKSSFVGTYFDGATADTPTAVNDWTGTANASTSTRSVYLDYTANGVSVPYRSDQWHDGPGAYSARLVPYTVSNDTFLAWGTTSWLPWGMVPGRSYVIAATRFIAAALTGTLHANAGRIVVEVSRDGSTWDGAATVSSPAAPNTAADVTRMSVQVAVPSDATGVRVALYHGGAAGSGDVWWDQLLVDDVTGLAPGDVRTSYFDGDFDWAAWRHGGVPGLVPSIGYRWALP